MSFPCKIVGFFGEDTYGKFPTDGAEEQIVMEWKHWLGHVTREINARWRDNTDFMNYLAAADTVNEYVPMLMMTLPAPRY